MQSVVEGFVAGFPDFLISTAAAGLLLLAASVIYILLTPWKELALVRGGNGAAGIALSGAIIGLAVPITSALASSHNVLDLVIWGTVALLLQLIAYRIVDMILRDIPKRIEQDDPSAAIVLATAKISCAMLLAAGLWDPSLARF
ncbi:MAG: DUF350 domain-containing protein [Pseudomonadota bacterium]